MGYTVTSTLWDLCTYPGTKKAVERTLDFHFNPPITAEDNTSIAHSLHAMSKTLTLIQTSRDIA